ncbi:sigma 54-interacting transcriptional regulator [Enterococcus crotali]|uniref:sigma 54-interacting transcriptional regulator n=1 Tax=Enterococcus crotali TaxID=1453587 RepID=UPI00046F47B6|nr:sigma 54-interacting transcriptional regulator [Enterococcus crotali]
MRSIDNFFLNIKETLLHKSEMTTQEVEQLTGMKRSIVSLYLNQLVSDHLLNKTNTRPVKFYLPHSSESAFIDFIGFDGSIKKQIDQCKSSVTYPPNGLPVLLHGSSGVGKSYLAKLIHRYAQEKKEISADAPFVVLNCADYANNKELLSSLLFGYVKGAFSGAQSDKEGLIHEAEGGYLFLDEVHNLSAENQEKLFLLIDEKKYRPLGVNGQWKQSTVRLIMATTEDPESSLLVTFKRRIPFEVFLPDFKDRTFAEKENLVFSFFKQESIHLDCSLSVGESYISTLIEADFKGNIGEIRNKIRADCAEAYNKGQAKGILEIGFPPVISLDKESAAGTFSHQDKASSLEAFAFIEYTEAANVAEMLVNDLHLKWVMDNYSLDFLLVVNDVERFFRKQPEIADYLNRYGIKIDDQLVTKLILFSLLIHYDPFIERVKIKDIVEAQYNFHKYFRLAKGLLTLLFLSDGLIHENEIALLAAYLLNVLPIKSKINALVIMHGKKNAFSLARAANQLVGDFVFESFDMPIDMSIKEIINEVNVFIKQYNTTDGLVLLVDMGSLEQMYKKIQGNVTGDLLIMNNVSTALALDVGLRLSQNQRIGQLEQLLLDDFGVSKQYYAGVSQQTNLLISCISGEGIALKIRDIIDKYTRSEEIELLSMDFTKLNELLKKDQKVMFKDTIAILSTSNIDDSIVPVINIESIINGADNLSILAPFFKTTESIKKCTNEIIKLFTLEGATDRLSFLNPTMVINEVEEVIESYESFYKIEINNFMRINLFLHLSTMIERILTGDGIDSSDVPVENMSEYHAFKEISLHFFSKIENKYKLTLPDGEIKMIYLILREQI